MFGHWSGVFKNSKMTSDADKIIKGMIYIDRNTANRKEIYKAYKKGAALIVTNKTVTDPNIPVLKVKDIEEAYFDLLNILYERPLDIINLIGVYGGSKWDFVVDLLIEIFLKHFTKSIKNKDFKDFTYFFLSEKTNSTAEKLFYYILFCITNNIKVVPINYCRDIRKFDKVLNPKYDCSIVIDDKTVTKSKIIETGSNKPLFINIDNPYILKDIDGQKDNIVITFGLNKKAAVTATSIEYGDITKFNYCLQRSFESKSGTILEPFEAPMAIKGFGINKIYAALAVISCSLYYDVDLECVKEVLYKFEDKGRDFSINKYNDFTVINSYCRNEKDYKETFERMQMIDYEYLYIIISVWKQNPENLKKLISDLVNEWWISLNIKELIILTDEEVAYTKKFMKIPENISVKCFKQMPKAISSVISNISSKDVFLILGGDEMNSCQPIIELLVKR